VVIYRQIDGIQRWDEIVTAVDARRGAFELARFRDGRTEFAGCEWSVAGDDRAELRVFCSDGGMSAWAEGVNAAKLSNVETRESDRTIAGQRASCYRASPLNEVCVSDRGLILYAMIGQPGSSSHTIEAVSISANVESFAWPDGQDAAPSFPNEGEAIVPASDVQMPAAVGLCAGCQPGFTEVLASDER
jgi:hypothetical protein